jgi:hypothetical protein
MFYVKHGLHDLPGSPFDPAGSYTQVAPLASLFNSQDVLAIIPFQKLVKKVGIGAQKQVFMQTATAIRVHSHHLCSKVTPSSAHL